MKFELKLLRKPRDAETRRTPGKLFGGRMRTSTLVLLVAFVALWWTYATYGPKPVPAAPTPPPAQVVPPGFVPDPDYTWVPRTRVQQPFTKPATTTPPTTTTTPPTTTTTMPGLPPLPCLLPAPLCPESTTPTAPPSTGPQQPSPGPGPTPTPTQTPTPASTPPAR